MGEVVTMLTLKIQFFWDVTLWQMVDSYQCFRRANYLDCYTLKMEAARSFET